MKKIARIAKFAADGVYCVSAAEVADKLLDRMSRGLDPRLFSHSVLRAPVKLPSRARSKSD